MALTALTGTSVPLLLVAAAGVGIVHSILPDHWVPLAVIARANRWSLARAAKVSFLASLGHVAVSLALGVLLAAAGLALRNAVVAKEGHIVGGVLVLTGMGFLVWALSGHGHRHAHPHVHGAHDDGHGGVHVHADNHTHGEHDHPHEDHAGLRGEHRSQAHGDQHEHAHGHSHGHEALPGSHERAAAPSQTASSGQPRRGSWITGVAVPFGVAASPDLTILPVFLAASAVGVGPAVGSLVTFTVATILTFVVMTVAATAGGYRVRWQWLDDNAHAVTALVLLAVGALIYAGA